MYEPLACPVVSAPFSCGSMVARVRENGFAGAPLGELTEGEAAVLFHTFPSVPRSSTSRPVGS